MPKIVAMIPARLASKRVKNKNLRLLDGKPLVCHVIETCKKVKIFDDIYLNSESNVFREIALKCGVQFYKRPEYLAWDTATNDDFVLDFLKNIECNILIQVNPTSPLLTVTDITKFVTRMKDSDCDTLLSVKQEQIEAIYDGKPLNFDPLKPMPRSQDLQPVLLFSSGIMGWKVNKYLDNMMRFGCATYGGDGKTGYFILTGFSTIDIDTEDDFKMAELAIVKKHSESDVPSIMVKDGVVDNELFDANKPLRNIDDLIAKMPANVSWSNRIINTENNSAVLICQLPGEGNRLHYHPDWNEWWYIISGEWEWEIEGKTIIVREGDIVFIEQGKLHKITAIGDLPAIRLAVSREDVEHIYPEK